MASPMFSFVIPIYNVELYLEKCLSSLLKQSFSDYEIILIDDGSTDSSADLCKQYADGFPNITTYRQTNSGQGVARNWGINLAKGMYICFVDADDWIEPDLLQDVMPILESNLYDFINFGLDYVDDQGQTKHEISKFPSSVLNGKDIFESAMLETQVLSSPVNKIYRADFLRLYSICFPNARSCEDIYFSRTLSFHASAACFISKVYYHALIREGSTTRNFSISLFSETKAVIEKERSFLIAHDAYEINETLFSAHVIKQFSYLLVLAAFRCRSDSAFAQCSAFYKSEVQAIKRNKLQSFKKLAIKNKLIVLLCLNPRLLGWLVLGARRFNYQPY